MEVEGIYNGKREEQGKERAKRNTQAHGRHGTLVEQGVLILTEGYLYACGGARKEGQGAARVALGISRRGI
jgi:hypothetical protein